MMIVAWVVAPAALAAGGFDGEWKVTLTTTGGRCLKYYVFPVTIRHGAIKGVIDTGVGRYDVRGRVSEDGSFAWGWGHGTGKLSDHEGTGQWATTGGVKGDACSGEISLQRERS
jgi:hypothetical protein